MIADGVKSSCCQGKAWKPLPSGYGCADIQLRMSIMAVRWPHKPEDLFDSGIRYQIRNAMQVLREVSPDETLSPEELAARLKASKALAARAKQQRLAERKAEAAKLKAFKYRMEVTRTGCAILALVMNVLVLSHVLKLW
jgi:hypothetical protein